MGRTSLLAVALCCSLAVCAIASKRDPKADEDLLPGWEGNNAKPDHQKPEELGFRIEQMKVLDSDARIFMYEHFISDEEADHIVSISEKRLARSGVVGNEGGSKLSEIRTSFGVFLDRGEDPIVKRIEERIAAWTLMPMGNGEGMQVLRYNKEQKYDAHWDYFFHKEGTANGGNRYATVLTYLVDTEEGGETVFPNIPAPGGENVGFSECARYHLAAKPKKGTAILFHSIKPTGELERKSLHTACPVIKGIKWSMAKWIHVGHYAMGGERREAIDQHPQPKVHDPKLPPGCDDADEMCENWAADGECERNAMFMIGTRARPGKCIASCKRCDLVSDTGAEGTYDQWKDAQEKEAARYINSHHESRRSLSGKK
ncbi:hypothetical protein HYH03_011945 [Edaphochlamys debaryana]|uniref:procollagen-proline 4-dioxygenase n=1 Tax=Edaphochlamys debaryana TaxID=47281 RepID=A0A836BUY3_9CHLO|nr:hypothetical protein HYH03_011945 [Edaphochlamys debaryana]|eukprot:KAG2489492.1 hypothetical protein HYH03_011945 [Edaphochlamys debaryana]